jgi:hypothetical protein
MAADCCQAWLEIAGVWLARLSTAWRTCGSSPTPRHGRGSILITSQLPVASWHEVIGEPTLADAILDRIVHNAYRLELDGPSMRKLKAGEATEPTTRHARHDRILWSA